MSEKRGCFSRDLINNGLYGFIGLGADATSRRVLPSRMFVAYDKGCLIGSGFSKPLVAVWSEKRVSSIGFENGKPLKFRWVVYLHPADNYLVPKTG